MIVVLFIVAVILMALGAFPLTSRVDLWKLGTACLALAFVWPHLGID